jgi:zinc protease
VRGYCATGGVYEGKWLGGGLSHLLEHLVAGGSNDRRTEAENKNLLQNIGNDSNAYTSEDHTAYFVNTTIPHMEEAVDLVTGWMVGAQITFPEYRREYQVVQRELERGKGMPDSVYWNLFITNRYHVSPMRVPVIGYQEVIQGLSRDDVYSYYQQAYQPNNMVFAVVGDIDPETMLAAVRKNLSDVKPGRVFSHEIAQEPPVLGPRTMVATFPKLGPARVDLAFPSIKLDHPDLYALDLLGEILGGGESSALVEELRDNKQLVSGVSCEDWTPSFVDGSFMIDMQLDADKVQPAIAAALALVADVREHGVPDDRLARAKTQLRMAHLKQLQTSQDVAATMATDFLSTGDPHFSDLYVERIATVTPAQVLEVAKKYLDPSKLITTVLLPAEAVGTEGLPKAEDLLRAAVSSIGATPKDTGAATAGAQKTRRFVLENGTVLLTKRFTTTPLISVRMYALGGVTAETADTNGLGKLTMALLPRGAGNRSAEQIAEFFDSIGGDLGTDSGNNTWAWSMVCSKQDLAAGMGEFADIVLHPTFADADVAAMKQRLIAAISGQDAEWHNRAFRFFKKVYFSPSDSPYQFMSVGTAQNMKTFTAEQVKGWYAQKILKAPRVMTIFGDVDADQAKQMAQSLLGGGDKVPTPAPRQIAAVDVKPDSATPFVNVTRVEVQKTEQGPASVVIGFGSNSVIGEPAEATGTRAYTLAAGYSYPTGYIFETLRGLGLSYEAAAYENPGQSEKIPGALWVYAACDPSKVNEVTRQLLLNIARLQGGDADMQPDWFTRSQGLIVTSDAMQNETPEQQSERAALDELFGLGYDYHDKFAERIGAVTLDGIRAYARTRYRDCVVTICTPDTEVLNIPKGKQEYSSFPTVDLTPKGIQLDTGAPK